MSLALTGTAGDGTSSDAYLRKKLEALQMRLDAKPVGERCLLKFHRGLGAPAGPLLADEVAHFLKQPESSTLDFKEVCVNPKKVSGKNATGFTWQSQDIAKAVTGFANTATGGILICGVDNKTRAVVGVPEPQAFISYLTNAVKNCCRPRPDYFVGTVEVEGRILVYVDIPPASALSYVDIGGQEHLYRRCGDAVTSVTGTSLMALQQAWAVMTGSALSADRQHVPGATLGKFLEYSKLQRVGLGHLKDDPNRLQEVLGSSGLAVTTPAGPELTVAGLLLFAKDYPEWQGSLAGCADYGIQFMILYNDDLPGTPVNQWSNTAVSVHDIKGDALHMVDTAVQWINLLASQPYAKRVLQFGGAGGSVVRGDAHVQYPAVALSEILVNAVVHRSYFMDTGKIVIRVRHRSLEIVVPGHFVPGITGDTVGKQEIGSVWRNKVLARFMCDMRRDNLSGKVFEGWGLGVARARQLLEDVGGTLKYREESTGAGAVIVLVTASPTPVTSREASSGGGV